MTDQSSTRRTWEGDWRARILSRLSSLGFQTVFEFLQQFPCEAYVKLARRLGDDVAAIQLECLQFDEAASTGYVQQAALDSLIRDLFWHLTDGWEGCAKGNFATSGAYVDWLGRLEGSSRNRQTNCELREKGQRVWNVLEQLQPPIGWLPVGLDDPYLAAAFATGWNG
jgi:hypothetical protein